MIFPNFDFIQNRENQSHAFIFAQNNLNSFVQNLGTITQNNYKMAIVKFVSRYCKIAIKFMQIFNFQSLKFKVWTLKPYWGPKAPSRAPGGPKGPQSSAGARRKGAQCPELLVTVYAAQINTMQFCTQKYIRLHCTV